MRSSNASSIASSGTGSEDRHDVMVKFLYRRCLQSKWLEPAEDEFGNVDGGSSKLGVMLKLPDGTCTAEPTHLNQSLVKAVEKLGVSVAFTMSSGITNALLPQIPPFRTELCVDSVGFVLPIVNSVKDIGSGKSAVTKESCICLCRNEKFVLVWSDSVPAILAHGADVETRLLGLIWGTQIANPGVISSYRNSRQSLFPTGGGSGTSTPRDPAMNENISAIQAAIEREEQGDRVFDPEKESQEVPKRPFLLTHAVVIGLSMILVLVVEMACIAKLVTEVRLDGKRLRFALVATIPLFGTFSLFFMIVIMGSLFQLFGPLSNVQGNSMFYSGITLSRLVVIELGNYFSDLENSQGTKTRETSRSRASSCDNPDASVQRRLERVWRRDTEFERPELTSRTCSVVIPTVTSLLAAVKYYEELGGTASIYVNDDGMRLVSPDLAKARKAFYELNHIGWCSRPRHCTKEGPEFFLRKGQFKKASNMNYCLDFSIRVEDEMLRLIEATCSERGCTQVDLTIEEENELYEKARNSIVEQDGGKTWAAGNVRLGEIILIVDSDTRVPEDCLLFGALEMHENPEVALLQHASGILQVANNVFENGITYFTNLIYTSIQFAVGNGDCAPFVGHNTFIRWKAIQSISWEEDGMTKFWSDSHVSEDFDVSLRLQMNDFVVRLATYHNGGFKEGVSLTVYDELARWEKYAYGCNELVFNPLHKWIYKGPFTRLFIRFLFSNIKVTSKVTIFAYIGTYYAIASAIPLTLGNYLIVGWLQDNVDQFYITSWKIFVGMAVVFNILSPLAYAMLRHRLGQETFFWSLVETVKWTPMFLLFFGGISYHLLKAILCHFFGINMEWTTTAKELEESGFRVGLDRIVRDFKYMYLFIVPMVAGMIYLAQYAPRGWVIKDFAAIVPIANQIGCHALLPVSSPSSVMGWK
ncbi:hypothetical protein FGG08_002277 [Glutinoglossum americanum]|uniref:Glycosyltransferase 2-like domain-containing protein n=1 Tax=Glutinoglossum americanum TaxID=1670608 RepID=A0A9P8I522_9PEZI|nr:hypothetical protein FGG08_002277 [Glutinoglossum americanum]